MSIPSPAHIRRAIEEGVCPWCGQATLGQSSEGQNGEGQSGDLCSECGHHTRRALGPPDPGSRQIARWALFLALALIIAVACVQQLGGSSLQAAHAPTKTVEPPSAQFELTAKIFTKCERAFPDPKLRRNAVKAIDDQAHSEEDQLRAIMMEGELFGAAAALKRLEEFKTVEAESPLVQDAAILRRIYEGMRVDAGSLEILRKHHGWFGELAGTFGIPDSDPVRAGLLAGGWTILLLAGGVGFIVLGATIAGVVLLVLVMVRRAGRGFPTAFIPPAPGGSLAIEMAALFVLGFLVLKGLSAAAEQWLSGQQALWFTLIAQWGLLAVTLWPRVRGGTMELAGWHRGRGVLREIGAGLAGYLTCIPLMFVGVIVSLTLMFVYTAVRYMVTGQAPPATPENPVLEIASGKAGVLVTVMVFLLASLWAPVVEETIFRGCLYRHLRSYWHWFPAGVLTALCFGVMHGYPFLMLGPVIALGFGFSLLREWRGSLIAPMTAHLVHNTFVFGLLVVGMRLIDA